jgi:hypothetical protein
MASDQDKTTDHLGRSDKDFAIEFGGYLANSSDRFLDAVQGYLRGDEGGDDLLAERWKALDSAIYEFRKRAKKAGATNDAQS